MKRRESAARKQSTAPGDAVVVAVAVEPVLTEEELAAIAREERIARAGLPRVVEPQRCCCVSDLHLGGNRKSNPKDCPYHTVLADVDPTDVERLDNHIAERHTRLDRRLCGLQEPRAGELIDPKVSTRSRNECVKMLRKYSDLIQRSKNRLSDVQLHDVHTRRTTLFIALRQYQHALAEAKFAMEVLPNSPVTYFQIGSVLFVNGLFSEAAEAFVAGLRFHPGDKRLRLAFRRAQVRMRAFGTLAEVLMDE